MSAENANPNFSDTDKIEAFDKISSLFYDRNFGSSTKSDIETLMFSIFMKALIKEKCGADGALDYSACSDYKIGKILGLTPQRVSALKVRAELKFPEEDFDWKRSLKKILSDRQNISSNKQDMIQINIPDPNLFNAVQDYIEDNKGIVDIQLNRKILSVSQHDFIILVSAVADETEKEAIIKEINKCLKEKNDSTLLNETATIKNISSVVKTISDISELIVALAEMTNPVGAAFKIVLTLIKTLERQVQ